MKTRHNQNKYFFFKITIEKQTEKNQIQRDTVKTEALGGLCNDCSLPHRSSFSFALSPASQENWVLTQLQPGLAM